MDRKAFSFPRLRPRSLFSSAVPLPTGEVCYHRGMAGNTFGQAFRLTTAGETHGPGNVVIIDGVPPGLPLSVDDLLVDLARRRPGQSKIVTQRQEADAPEILSGVFEGKTTGTPLGDPDPQRRPAQPGLRRHQGQLPPRPRGPHLRREVRPARLPRRRPGQRARDHGPRGGRRVAKKLIADAFGGRVMGYVAQVGDVRADVPDPAAVTLDSRTRPDRGAEHRPLPGSRRGRADDRADRRRAESGRLHRRRGGDRGHGRPRGAGRAGVRQDQGRPRQSPVQPARGDRRGIRRRLRWPDARGSENNDLFERRRPEDRHPKNRHGGMLGGITSGHADRAAGCGQADQFPAARAGHGDRPAKRPRSSPKAATTPACCRASSRWPRRWSRSSSPITGYAGKASDQDGSTDWRTRPLTGLGSCGPTR